MQYVRVSLLVKPQTISLQKFRSARSHLRPFGYSERNYPLGQYVCFVILLGNFFVQFWKIVLQLCPPSFKICLPVSHGLLKAEKVLVLERPQASATSRVLCVDWHATKPALFEEFE